MNNSVLSSSILQRLASEKTAEQLASYFQTRVLNDGGTYEANQCLIDNIRHLQNLGLLNSVGLAVFPNAKKIGKFYSLFPKNGSGDFSFTRVTIRTIFNSSGQMETIAINMPPIDYSQGGSCPTLSLDNLETNYFVNSDTLATQNVSVSAIVYTVSFWGTGTITFSGAYTGSLVGTGSNNRVSVTFTPSAGTLTCTVSGSVLKGQMEANPFATSYYPSGATTGTRGADSLSLNSLDGILKGNKGTMFCDIAPAGDGPATAGPLVAVDDIEIWSQLSGPTRWAMYTDNGGSGAGLTPNKSQRYKIAISFNGPVVRTYANGTQISSHSNRTSAKPANALIRGTQGSITLNVPLILFDTDLLPEQMARLTTI